LPAQPPWVIIGRTGKPACLRGQLSSNVRPSLKSANCASQHGSPSGLRLGRTGHAWSLRMHRGRCTALGHRAVARLRPVVPISSLASTRSTPPPCSGARAPPISYVHRLSTPSRRGLTPRSSRPATAGRLARAAALVHHRPHGQAVLPPRSA
jgi:hypothetical protein